MLIKFVDRGRRVRAADGTRILYHVVSMHSLYEMRAWNEACVNAKGLVPIVATSPGIMIHTACPSWARFLHRQISISQ